MNQLKWRLLLAICLPLHVTAQLRPIDSTDIDSWPEVGMQEISPDGRYICYTRFQKTGNTSFIQSVDTRWIRQLPAGSTFQFSNDGKYLIVKTKDSLEVIALSKKKTSLYTQVDRHKLTHVGKLDFLLWSTGSGALNVLCLQKSNLQVLARIYPEWRQKDELLLFHSKRDTNVSCADSVFIYNLSNQVLVGVEASAFGDSGKIGDAWFDGTRGQLVFFWETSSQHRADKTLWLWQMAHGRPALLLDETKASKMGMQLQSANVYGFTRDGVRFFLQLEPLSKKKLVKSLVSVDIWSYRDAQLQSQQLLDLKSHQAFVQRSHVCEIFLHDRRELMLDSGTCSISLPFGGWTKVGSDSLLLGTELRSDQRENIWDTLVQNRYYVVDAITRRRTDLPMTQQPELSPTGKYAVYYNSVDGHYYSFETAGRRLFRITDGITVPLTSPVGADYAIPVAAGIATWSKDGEAVYLYSKYDIYKCALNATGKVTNITKGYGQQHNISFSFSMIRYDDLIGDDQTLILVALDNRSKDCGFFKVRPAENGDPQKLFMGPYMFHLPTLLPLSSPQKARFAERYIVSRQDETGPPNLYVTSDFKRFRAFTDIAVPAGVNWLNTELVQWQSPNGDSLAGILYKPADFNPSKRYPVITTFYERNSEQLHVFLKPGYCDGTLNIPAFVSQGYLVFVPDIVFRTGHTGQSALDAVLSGVNFIKHRSYIDSTHLGIHGHSFGGYESNFIVSHTSQFAAASSAAGMTDMISDYGLVSHGGRSRRYFYEAGQTRMGKTLWEGWDQYVENSPVYSAPNVNTPLLMMHNQKDQQVPFSQGLEFFNNLRRLRKKVWLLQYDEGGHTVTGLEAADYHHRLLQFFNHYLKGEPAPIWMTKGIPAVMKGIETGYSLDADENCGKYHKIKDRHIVR